MALQGGSQNKPFELILINEHWFLCFPHSQLADGNICGLSLLTSQLLLTAIDYDAVVASGGIENIVGNT